LLGPSADILKPLGLTIDKHQFPVSPRSEAAYDRINSEFDKLMEQLYAMAEAPKVCPRQDCWVVLAPHAHCSSQEGISGAPAAGGDSAVQQLLGGLAGAATNMEHC
jgi:Holliday junction regulator protein family C-terminal repeat